MTKHKKQSVKLLENQPLINSDFSQGSPLFTVEQAAEYLTLSKSTLDIWRITGGRGLPFVKLGRAVRYRKSDLDKYLTFQTVGLAAQELL